MVPRSLRGRYARRVSDPSHVTDRAAAAYRALADLAETVEEEWQYVTDLVVAYLPGISSLAGDGDRPLTGEQIAAVDEAISEIELITDPHKAIDWLSTFPHVVALALGGDVDEPAAPARNRVGAAAGEPGLDEAAPEDAAPEEAAAGEDSPFRSLRFGR
jgi:hypothetical protein